MKRLSLDLTELAVAVEDHSYAFDWYLDTETGDVVMLPGEAGDPGDWPEDELDRIERMLEEESGRLEPVPRFPSYRVYRWMVNFAETVGDQELRRLLWVALDGKGAFGRFKRVLAEHPDERERWFRYHEEHLQAEVRGWLETIGIEPADGG